MSADEGADVAVTMLLTSLVLARLAQRTHVVNACGTGSPGRTVGWHRDN